MSVKSIDYQGEKISMSELIRRFYLMNKESSSNEIVAKIKEQTGIDVKITLVYAVKSTIGKKEKRAKKVQSELVNVTTLRKEKNSENSNVEGLKLLRKSVELLGYANASAYLTIFKD